MKHAQLLDCTLRDGGYLVDGQFGENTIKDIIRSLTQARIDVVECGFLKNEPHQKDSTVFSEVEQVREYLPEDRGSTSYVLLADYSRYDADRLTPYDGTSVDGIRACFFKNELPGALDFCRKIKANGYKLYVQPVGILSYTDRELLDLIEEVNLIGPYAFSLVDTFGSMYPEDLERIFYLVHNNLDASIRLGFHSHNNLQMSFALSQRLAALAYGVRGITIDTTMCGMGRGAGNTNTELVAQYLNQKYEAGYDMDTILDISDFYIENIRSRCQWGYTVENFIAGVYSAHVNNISYLMEKSGIRSKDIRYILNAIGPEKCKRYDYDLLEKTLVEYKAFQKDDADERTRLRELLRGREILVLAPGKSLNEHRGEILSYIEANKPFVIAIQMIPDAFPIDAFYCSNVKRYRHWSGDARLGRTVRILTSNVKETSGDADEYIVNYAGLIKCGWNNLDNAAVLLLRLLDFCEPGKIVLAGLDGYSTGEDYMNRSLEAYKVHSRCEEINCEMASMLADYRNTRSHDTPVAFLTRSRFEEVLAQG